MDNNLSEATTNIEPQLTEAQRKSRANLVPFLPGRSGNPAGRKPRIKYISELAATELDKRPLTFNGKPNNLTWRQLVVRGWLEGAVQGPLLGELLNRLEGSVSKKVELDAHNVDVVFQIGQGYKEIARS